MTPPRAPGALALLLAVALPAAIAQGSPSYVGCSQ
jgi:hypothetical protein